LIVSVHSDTELANHEIPLIPSRLSYAVAVNIGAINERYAGKATRDTISTTLEAPVRGARACAADSSSVLLVIFSCLCMQSKYENDV